MLLLLHTQNYRCDWWVIHYKTALLSSNRDIGVVVFLLSKYL